MTLHYMLLICGHSQRAKHTGIAVNRGELGPEFTLEWSFVSAKVKTQSLWTNKVQEKEAGLGIEDKVFSQKDNAYVGQRLPGTQPQSFHILTYLSLGPRDNAIFLSLCGRFYQKLNQNHLHVSSVTVIRQCLLIVPLVSLESLYPLLLRIAFSSTHH